MSNLTTEEKENLDYFGSQIYQLQYNKNKVLVPKIQRKLQSLSQKSSLIAKFKSGEHIGVEGSRKIGSSFQHFLNLQILKLKFNKDNLILDKGLAFISEGLKTLKGLSRLTIVFNINNKIGTEGIQELSTCFSSLPLLNKLSFSVYQNQIQPEGLVFFSKGIVCLNQLKQLKLVFVNSDIDSDSLLSLGSTLVQLQSIKKINIFVCRQKDEIAKGVEGLLKDISHLHNLEILKFKAKASFRDLDHFKSIDFNHLASLPKLKVLNIDLPFYKKDLFLRLHRESTLKNLEILCIEFNQEFSVEFSQSFAAIFQGISNLQELTIKLSENHKHKIDFEAIDTIKRGIQFSKELKHLSINTETELDFCFISLLQDLPKLQTMILQRQTVISYDRQNDTKDITSVNIPFDSSQKERELEFFSYVAESLPALTKLKEIKIDLLDLCCIKYENGLGKPIKIYDELMDEWNYEKRELKESIILQVKKLVKAIQNHPTMINFEMTIKNQNSKESIIKGFRNNQKAPSDFSIQMKLYIPYYEESLAQFLYLCETLRNLGKSVRSISFDIWNCESFNTCYLPIFIYAIQPLSELTSVELSIKFSRVKDFDIEETLASNLCLKNLLIYKFKCPKDYDYISRRKVNRSKLIRRNIRLISYQ